jgi:hypothetical protein
MNTAAPLQSTATKSHATNDNMLNSSLLLQRKCACGAPKSPLSGECEACKSKNRLQTKLRIGASNDPLELEADRVADQVLSAPAHSGLIGTTPRIQRFTRHSSGQADTAPDSVDRVLADSGRPLDKALQQDMGQRFGHDFSQVRVHTGSAAEQSARDVNAYAYTVGNDIVFGLGRFDSNVTEGRRLIAHELTHVIQQSGEHALGTVTRQPVDAGLLQRNDEKKTPPKAPKCDTGLALRWGQDTTCSKWGFFESVHEQGEGKKWRSFNCCNSWPLSLENHARSQGLNGAASCKVLHEREIATITLGDKEVEVLCSDTIPTDKSQVIEMSPKAMQDLSGQLTNPVRVSVCYSGSKQNLCLHNGPGAKSFPTVNQCLTRGCPVTEGTPSHDDSGWPRV